MKAKSLDTTVMTALDSIAWTFNIRGGDVGHEAHAEAAEQARLDPVERLRGAVGGGGDGFQGTGTLGFGQDAAVGQGVDQLHVLKSGVRGA